MTYDVLLFSYVVLIVTGQQHNTAASVLYVISFSTRMCITGFQVALIVCGIHAARGTLLADKTRLNHDCKDRKKSLFMPCYIMT